MKSERKRLSLFFSLLVAACGVAILLAGCAKKQESSSPTTEQPKKVYTWKLQAAYSPPENFQGYLTAYGQAVEIAKRVKERTNGGLDIKVYPPDALFKPSEAPEALKKGAVEMVLSNGSYHSSILPEAILEPGLPYGAKTSQEVYKLLYGTDYFKILRQAYAEKHNAYLLGLTSVSSYNYLTKFPVKSLEDLKGKKIRAAGPFGQIAQAHGAVPVNLAPSEQYMGLQRGTIEGTIYPPYTGITYKLFEVTKYQIWPPVYPVMTVNFLVNMDAWKSLPKEYQDILQEEVDKMVKYTFEVSGPAFERIAQEEGKKQFGSETIWLSDAEYEKFRRAVIPIWDEWAKKSDYCAQLVKIAKEAAGIK